MSETSPKSMWITRLSITSALFTVILAGIMAFAAQYVDIVMLYPLLLGMVAGLLALFWHYRVVKNRNGVILIAGFLAIMGYAVYRYADYLLVLRELENSIPVTFGEYLSLTAKLGITITKLTNNSFPIELGETMTWFYWGCELLLAIGFSIYVALQPPQKFGLAPVQSEQLE